MIIFALLVLLARHAFAQDFTLVDDQNPRIQYGGGTGTWVFKSRTDEFNGTIMLTRSGNATATLIFNGTGIAVYGRVDSPDGNSTVSTYAINNGTPTVFNAPPVPLTSVMTKVLFYSSPVLSPGEQTITVTNLNDNAWFWLDYFNITVNQASIANPSSVQPSSVQPSIATSTSVQVSPKKDITAGAGVGITLGAGCFLAIAILCYIWLKKRRSRTRNVSSFEGNHQDLAIHQTGSVTNIRNNDVVQPFLRVPAASTELPHLKTLMSSLPLPPASRQHESDASTLPPPYTATV
ncbi:hypothetical protein BYT27DRAFT_7179547 [Phlegmacium glaucopus]|nr:hypothetical protein BYT27DRAFT_7179547 [Phlegmacium glaucopus]